MVTDWMHARTIGLYVVAELDGRLVHRVEMTRERPAFKALNTPFVRDLKRYFETGQQDFFAYEVDYTGTTRFQRNVMETLRKVPPGETVTYGRLAAAAGRPGAARAVGNVMANNPVPILVPCHRVVAAGGLGGFTGGLELKRALLRLEGVSYP